MKKDFQSENKTKNQDKNEKVNPKNSPAGGEDPQSPANAADKQNAIENESLKHGENGACGAKNAKIQTPEEKQIDPFADRYIRICAEYDNYRKRSEREKGESFHSGMTMAVMAFLPLLDNLDIALSYEPENQGLKLICDQARGVFEKLGVTEIESDGKNFDPNLHNAVMHEEDAESGENLVAQTFQKGYMFGDKVIRHASVKVVN